MDFIYLCQMNVVNEAIHSLVAFGYIIRTMDPWQVMVYAIVQVAAICKSSFFNKKVVSFILLGL